MNKLLFVGIVCITELSFFAGEAPKNPTVKINILKTSTDLLRRSSDAITIPAATTKTLAVKNHRSNSSSSSSHSSGSSPSGCEHLFPGQTGIGYRQSNFDWKPIDTSYFASCGR